MIRLIEVDLACPEPVRPSFEETWVLVRYNGEVLGEARFARIDYLGARRLHDELRAEFGPWLAARSRLRVAGPEVPAPAVSVVVCTRDRPALLVRCLEALHRLDPPAAEILVVDNAPSTSETEWLCAGLGVRRVVEPEPGLNWARNRGWRCADGEVVAYVDDDALADRRFAGVIALTFLHPGVGALTGLVLAAELETYVQVYTERTLGGMRKGFARQLFDRATVTNPLESFRYGVGTNMAFRKSVLSTMGGFDPRLDVGTATRGGGDLDALFRVADAGHVLVYEPNALVRHVHRVSRAELLAQHRDNGTAFAAYLAVREEEGRAAARAVRAYRRSWHLRRHVVGVARAARSKDFLGVQVALAEAVGSRAGRAALALETARRAERVS